MERVAITELGAPHRSSAPLPSRLHASVFQLRPAAAVHSTRDWRTSRITRKLLKTKDGDTLYPRLSPGRAFWHGTRGTVLHGVNLRLPASRLKHPEPNRYTRTIRNRCKLLKTKDPHPSYSVQFSSPGTTAFGPSHAPNDAVRINSKGHRPCALGAHLFEPLTSSLQLLERCNL
jgi:hypothetical protein